MKNNHLTTRDWIERIALALVFIGFGALIMIIFKPWGKQFIADRSENYLWRIGICLILLVLAWLVKRSTRYEKYWQIFFAIFILSSAVNDN
jgi:uncharacterized protein YjeT (DUF2065 family)